MEKATRIASYLLTRYRAMFGETMDEIKLQKLLYFTQREAIFRTGEPMFDAEFRAWKYGPVITEIHERYMTMDFSEKLSPESEMYWKDCFDYVFEEFAPKKTMSLVSLAHGFVRVTTSKMYRLPTLWPRPEKRAIISHRPLLSLNN